MKEKELEIIEPYFAEREERAVIDYISTNSQEEKNRIYNEILIEPFRKMIETILRRYPIYIGNYSMIEVESNALNHLIEQMVKYRPFIIEKKNDGSFEDEKWIKLGDDYRFMHNEDAIKKLHFLNLHGDSEYRIFYSKAYSYCQTIIRNYYKDHGKKSYNEMKINLSYDDYVEEIDESLEFSYEMEFETNYHLDNLIDSVIKKIEEHIELDGTIKKNEIIVGDAIINVLKNWHVLFMEETPTGKYNKKITNKYAKNKILLFLKEQTGLSTKEIRLALKPFKEIYFIEKINKLNH